MTDTNRVTPPDNQDQTNGAISTAPAGKSDADWLRLASEAYSGSTSYFDTAIRRRLLDNLRLFQSQHPQGSKYDSDAYRARSRFFRPKTRAAVRKNEATAAEAFFANEDVVTIDPLDPSDPMQRTAARMMQSLVHYRLKHSVKWFQTVIGAYQDAQVQGMVCSYQPWLLNPKKGIDQPGVQLVPLENVRFDAAADWADPLNTSPYFIHMIPMWIKDVRARTKTIDTSTGMSKWRPVTDAALLKASTMMLDPVRAQRGQERIDPQTGRTAITDFTIVWVHRNIIEIDGEDWIYHTLGTQELLDKPRPLDEAYFHGKRPYVIGSCVVQTHRAYQPAPVELSAQVQAELNENANQRSDNVKFAMNKRYFAKRGAAVDLRSLQRNVPSSVTLMGDPEKDVKVVDTPDVTRSAYEEQDRLNLDFDDLIGSFSQASVQANRKLNETVGGMNMLTKDASQVSGYQLRTFVETWAQPVLDQLVLLEQHYETDDTILALCAKDAQVSGIINAEMLTQACSLGVNVGLGATSPHDRLTNFLQAIGALKEVMADGVLMQMGIDLEEVIKEVMGALGYKDGKRFFPDDRDPTIAYLMQQVQKLSEAANAKHPPELIAAQVKEIMAKVDKTIAERVKVGVDTAFAAIQGAEVLAAVPQVAPVADALMQGAGYEPPPNGGVDPNFPIAPSPAPGIGIEPVKNKRTGMAFTPGGAGAAAGDTSPNTPATPGTGANRGIETARADSGPPQ